MAVVGNTVFAGTNGGLYRLNADVWEQLSVDVFKIIQSSENTRYANVPSGFYHLNGERVSVDTFTAFHALAVSENNLYVAVGPDIFTLAQLRASLKYTDEISFGGLSPSGIFRSSDFGASWTDITPPDGVHVGLAFPGVKLLAVGETLFVSGVDTFRSRDGGHTWTNLGMKAELMLDSFSIAAVNEGVFYSVGNVGIHRTTDAGESWHLFMDGIVGTGILDLIGFHNGLYAHTITEDVVRSTDGSES